MSQDVQSTKTLTDEVKSIRDTISASMDSLVADRGAGESYSGLDEVCKYFQWPVDNARLEEEHKNVVARVKEENLAMVEGVVLEFRKQNALLREQILWEWSPLWQVLSANEWVLQQLPEPPWSHNRK